MAERKIEGLDQRIDLFWRDVSRDSYNTERLTRPPATLLTDRSSDVNNSAVLSLEYGCFPVLLTEDIEQEGEEACLASGQARDSLALKVPHLGGDSGHTLPILQAAYPTAL